eukprot:750712-Pelagomonas_calceolata.AAC.2
MENSFYINKEKGDSASQESRNLFHHKSYRTDEASGYPECWLQNLAVKRFSDSNGVFSGSKIMGMEFKCKLSSPLEVKACSASKILPEVCMLLLGSLFLRSWPSVFTAPLLACYTGKERTALARKVSMHRGKLLLLAG